jgi:cation/acetate symporter
MIDPNASTARRVTISKVLLLVVALMAAYVAAQKPADILFLVSAAFSIAAAASSRRWCWASSGSAPPVPPLCWACWRRGRDLLLHGHDPALAASVSSGSPPVELWWGIQPISAGVFGVPWALR